MPIHAMPHDCIIHQEMTLEDIKQAATSPEEENKMRAAVDAYQKMANYLYWRTRAFAEAEPETAEAHRSFFEAKTAFRNQDFIKARTAAFEGMKGFDDIMKRPEYESLVDEELMCEECLLGWKIWDDIHQISKEKVPEIPAEMARPTEIQQRNDHGQVNKQFNRLVGGVSRRWAYAEIIAATAEHVRRKLATDSSGHDWWHIDRVPETPSRLRARACDATLSNWRGTSRIADCFAAMKPLVQGRPRWLASQHVEPAIVDEVCDIISRVIQRQASRPFAINEANAFRTVIGWTPWVRWNRTSLRIRRALCRLMYNPTVPLDRKLVRRLQSQGGPTINTLRKTAALKDRMQTNAGRHRARITCS